MTITGSLEGGAGRYSGEVGSLENNVTGVTVGGSVSGGTGGSSGLIVANLGTLGPVQITGNLQGGSVSGILSIGNSGYIFGSRITSVSITGSLISGKISGTGKLFNSGAIRATYDIGSINVGNLVGNSTNPVVISARPEPGDAHRQVHHRSGHCLDHCRQRCQERQRVVHQYPGRL